MTTPDVNAEPAPITAVAAAAFHLSTLIETKLFQRRGRLARKHGDQIEAFSQLLTRAERQTTNVAPQGSASRFAV